MIKYIFVLQVASKYDQTLIVICHPVRVTCYNPRQLELETFLLHHLFNLIENIIIQFLLQALHHPFIN